MCYLKVFFLTCVLFTVDVLSQMPISPCPKIFKYETDGYRWYGIIEAPNPPPYGSEMTVKVRMAIRARLPTSYVGRIELAEERDIVLQRIAQNWPIKYRVTFPLVSPQPSIMTINFAGKLICSGDPLYGRFITAIDLEHTLHSGESAIRNSPRDKLIIGGPIPLKNAGGKNAKGDTQHSDDDSVESRFATDVNNYEINFNPKTPDSRSEFEQNDNCGQTGNINPLIMTGDTAARGDWPWLVAIFLKKPRGLEFICAGSLISKRHIVTAAHCVKKRSGKEVKSQDLVVKLGVYNIQDWTEETAVTKSVASIKAHEYFDIGVILNNDIAILTLSQSVVFTDFIRPVCLWTGDIDLEKVTGQFGTIVGWGKDEKGIPTTPEPRVATVPIVSTTTCRASRPEFFKLTSDGTLCAGNRDGSGPCNGDSGGGLFIRQAKKWILRGIVSKSLKDQETHSCDLKEYVVYTDAAKYLDFIKS